MKEKKVYIINCGETRFDFRSAEWKGEKGLIKTEAGKLGSVYSLEFFQDKINDEELVLTNSFILID